MTTIRILPLILALVRIVNVEESNVLVTTRHGVLKGYVRETWRGRPFLAFQGIPYAQPPVGSRRFQPPVPMDSWEGVLYANKSHAFCPQRDLFVDDSKVFGDEDCLFLNIYTPKTATSEILLLPVIVYIHGGGFTSDSANPELYGPDILLDQDLVLVTINYRLGALGFLSLEDDVLPGNNGLKDQNLALKWVKSNINQFGGNPNKITIFGNSAGGASVYYHVLSPTSKGLFHAAMSSSGIATSSWALEKRGEARKRGKKLAKLHNCPTSSSQVILKCLQRVNAYDIVRHVHKLMEFCNETSIPYRPVIEPKIPGAFISDHPIDIIKSGQFAQVPYISGITKNEGAMKSAAFYANATLIAMLNDKFDDIAPFLFFYNTFDFKQKISRVIRRFYFHEKSIDNSTKSELTDVITDELFYYPQRATVELHSAFSSAPVYFYLFGYRGTESSSRYFGDPTHDYGVCHCDDLTYLLSNDYFDDYRPSQADLKMNDVMTTLLYNFANTGDPTPETDSIITNKWKPVNKNKFRYYAIMRYDEIDMKRKLFEKRYHFWKTIPTFSQLSSAADSELLNY